MIIGIILVAAPVLLYLASVPISKRLKLGLRKVYLFIGGTIVFAGTGLATHIAFFGGEQAGIAAYFIQLTVITSYLIFTFLIVLLHFSIKK